MTAPDPRVGEIQDLITVARERAATAEKKRERSRRTPDPVYNASMILAIQASSAYVEPLAKAAEDLLGLLRERDEALARVEALSDMWTKRGEHDMAYSKTIPDEDISMAILTDGATKVENARRVRAAVAAANGDKG